MFLRPTSVARAHAYGGKFSVIRYRQDLSFPFTGERFVWVKWKTLELGSQGLGRLPSDKEAKLPVSEYQDFGHLLRPLPSV